MLELFVSHGWIFWLVLVVTGLVIILAINLPGRDSKNAELTRREMTRRTVGTTHPVLASLFIILAFGAGFAGAMIERGGLNGAANVAAGLAAFHLPGGDLIASQAGIDAGELRATRARVSAADVWWSVTEWTAIRWSGTAGALAILLIAAMRFFRAQRMDDHIHVANIPIERKRESQHLLMAGTTGTGKTQAIHGIIDRALSRGDSLVVVDNGGEYLARYYDPQRDTIINPFDARSARWHPLLEIRHTHNTIDIDTAARLFVPGADGSGTEEAEWQGKAMLIIKGIIEHLYQRGSGSINDLIAVFDDRENLADHLAGTSAGGLAAGGTDDKQFQSAYGIATQRLAPWRALLDRRLGEEKICIRHWLARDDKEKRGQRGRVIWIPYTADQQESLAPILGALASATTTSMLSLDESDSRRVWLVMDELPALGPVASLESALAEGRKRGLRVVSGVQNVAQMYKNYGEYATESILGLFNSVLLTRMTGSEKGPDFWSSFVGKRIQKVRTESRGGHGKSTTTSEQSRPDLPAHKLRELPPLNGYLYLVGIGFTSVRIPVLKRKRVAAPFQLRRANNDAAEKPKPEPEPAESGEDQGDDLDRF